MRNILRFTSIALIVCAPSICVAQDVTTIELGQTITKEKGTTTDLYRFGVLTGTIVTGTVTSSGNVALVLYTPAGEEMLSSNGDGSATISAVIPLDDVFMIAVLRDNNNSSYQLKITGDDPDIYMSLFARGVGFARASGLATVTVCWIEPGIKKRTTFSDLKGYYSETTIGRQGYEYTEYFDGDAKRYISKTNRYRVEGGELVSDYDIGGAEPEQYRFPLAKEFENNQPMKYACQGK
ncbi:MAG: hypothetical protein O9293_13870 [Porphyrobacter sp.]|nr:hypothetical protein [Porphyrobacter sp.]